MNSLNAHTQSGYTELDDVTAKHSFLKNAELKAMTFSYLQVKNDTKNEYHYLLNVALTCKDFLEVALDALWEEMKSLVPLLQVLPALQLEDGAAAYVCANVYHDIFPYDCDPIFPLDPQW